MTSEAKVPRLPSYHPLPRFVVLDGFDFQAGKNPVDAIDASGKPIEAKFYVFDLEFTDHATMFIEGFDNRHQAKRRADEMNAAI